MEYKIAEKFVSINGEGTKAGQLAVFIRLCGCNLNCSYCDTKWANEKDVPFTLMTEEELASYVEETGVKNITLTGGEPLLDKNGEVIAEYEGYVPECVGCDGYGDYLEFEIDSASNIPEWEFTQEHLDEFMKESGDELYEDM